MKLTTRPHVVIDHNAFTSQYLIFNNGDEETFFESMLKTLHATSHGWDGDIQFFLFDQDKATLAWRMGAVFISMDAFEKYLAKERRSNFARYEQEDVWCDEVEEDEEVFDDDELPF